MNKSIRCGIILAIAIMGCLKAAALEGSWRGNLNIGSTSLPLVLNFGKMGAFTMCTLDSPNQNAYGVPASVDYISADSVVVSVSNIGAKFCGKVTQEEIVGVFSQGGYNLPLTLKREEPLSERRPQTPQPPYPYQEIDTVFHAADSTELSGTFVMPESYEKGKTVMCVFVTGSGPQNRDEEIFEHRPFAVIADFLGRNGIASFRYDDRGTAASKGDYKASTIDTFRDDAKAAYLFAKELSDGPTGIIGHSEGGTIAFLLAEDGLPDFIVSLAGMVVSGKETVMAQNRHSLDKASLEDKSIDGSMALISKVFDEIIRQNEAGEAAVIDVDAMAQELGVSVPPVILNSLKANLSNSNAYFATLLAVDARKGMSGIACPVLALNGELDTQVNAAENLDAVRKGVKDATAVMLPGLNHLFQHAQTGEVSEYGEIRETISPEVLSLILTFLQNL